MRGTNILVIDPPGGAVADYMRAWLVYRPIEGDSVRIVTLANDVMNLDPAAPSEAILMAIYTGGEAPRNLVGLHTELDLCLCNFEGNGLKNKINHCVVLSNLGNIQAHEIGTAVNKRWPHVSFSVMDRTAADGKSEATWPLALALRCNV